TCIPKKLKKTSYHSLAACVSIQLLDHSGCIHASCQRFLHPHSGSNDNKLLSCTVHCIMLCAATWSLIKCPRSRLTKRTTTTCRVEHKQIARLLWTRDGSTQWGALLPFRCSFSAFIRLPLLRLLFCPP